MRSELRKEILAILEKLSNGESRHLPLIFGTPALTIEAVEQLTDSGALSKLGSGNAYRITRQGYAYYEELKTPRKYWIKQHRGRVVVFIVSSLVTVGVSLIVTLLS